LGGGRGDSGRHEQREAESLILHLRGKERGDQCGTMGTENRGGILHDIFVLDLPKGDAKKGGGAGASRRGGNGKGESDSKGDHIRAWERKRATSSERKG